MPKLPEDFVERVRTSTNITDVVSKYVQLKKAGQNLFGLCPFHEERTASFSVNEGKQIFHCFSCGRGGNVFTFLMDLKGLSFPEAVEAVAKDDGIELPAGVTTQATNPKHQQQQPLIAAHQEAAQLYHHILVNTKLGETARAYLKKRQISPEMIDRFNLGYAPGNQVLQSFFSERKTDYQTLRKTGLFVEDQQGNLKDRFSNRLMFPIANLTGALVGFSGRLLQPDDNAPKYLNSPETEIFNKRRVLYNYATARQAARQEHRLILFEGFMDVISATQAGIENGVASMGTSLTEEQIYDLKRVTDHIDICYDGDTPGQKAIARAVTLLEQTKQFQIGVIQIPNGMDPDEYRREFGAAGFQNIVKSGREPVIKFRLRYLRTQFNLSNEAERIDYAQQATRLIASLDSSVERTVYLKDLATDLDLELASLQEQCDQDRQRLEHEQRPAHSKVTPPPAAPQQREQPRYSRVENAERQLLTAMLHDSNVWTQVINRPDFNFVHDDYQQLYLFAQEFFRQHAEYDSAEFSDFVGERHLQSVLAELEMTPAYDYYSAQAVADCVKIIQQDAPLTAQIKTLKHEFAVAEQTGNELQQLKLATDLIKLQQQLDRLKATDD
ncbi:DNA primase [Fructilactobacillus myrtifloralis]|uniref:DNA primase n=1 Tax=Fructilactobacillus myrtifloralis TaxID=2940301 RepID=A0ABY5BQ53_9LACO|nr:DNA primase [Fructilactobacillus myrtifloralis]USS85390.1 DNA primase [Fructilactobacillus myrtifloralis]